MIYQIESRNNIFCAWKVYLVKEKDREAYREKEERRECEIYMIREL